MCLNILQQLLGISTKGFLLYPIKIDHDWTIYTFKKNYNQNPTEK